VIRRARYSFEDENALLEREVYPGDIAQPKWTSVVKSDDEGYPNSTAWESLGGRLSMSSPGAIRVRRHA